MVNFDKAFDIVLGFEGGHSNDTDDAGGETKYGITKETARAHGYQGDMKALTLDDAKKIYKSAYWDALNLDLVVDAQAAREAFDIAVNMGVGTAGKFIQHALNLLNRNAASWPDIAEDGVIGTQTLTVLNDLQAKDLASFYKALNALQGKRYIEICERDPRQEKFFRGWLLRA
jgi:lysozyme family protein